MPKYYEEAKANILMKRRQIFDNQIKYNEEEQANILMKRRQISK